MGIMEKTIVDTKKELLSTISDLFVKLEDYSKNLDTRSQKLDSIKSDIDKKHADINTFQKVSFIANLNKQLDNKNSQIELLEKRIVILTRHNEKLAYQLKK